MDAIDAVPLALQPHLSLLEILAYSVLSFFIVLLFTPSFVAFLKQHRIGKQLRAEAVDGGDASVFLTYHSAKKGTPTMGGVLIWLAILITIGLSRALSLFGFLDFSLLQRGEVYLPLFSLIALGVLGGIDDLLNILGVGKKRGLDALPKLLTLLLISTAGALWFYFKLEYNTIDVPFGEYIGIPGGVLQLGWLYIPVFMFVLVGTANAVNVTDGLDGLAGGLLIIAFGTLGLYAFAHDQTILAGFCGVVCGSIAAFLWHNVPPALFFMGDTGSLALGGTLAITAMMIDATLLLPFVGFVFVLEMLSVIIQLTSKKIRGKKVFKSAPIHHHFEALGWGESKVTMRLWIVGTFMAFLGVLIGMYG